jgi:hypothetical protein
MKYYIEVFNHDELLESTALPFDSTLISQDLLGPLSTFDKSISTVLDVKFGKPNWTSFRIVYTRSQ